MHPNFQQLMKEATRLMRAGKLQAATAAIQSLFRGRAAPAHPQPQPQPQPQRSTRLSMPPWVRCT